MNYLDPDAFRRNTNQFLQTSRTVTFIIQKNKGSIPNFDDWYSGTVLKPWKTDKVMLWAIESRNFIEKEGDLDINSSLKLTLIFSYLTEEDINIECSKDAFLYADVKRLVRLAQKKLPSGISSSAVVKIERRWITSSLPQWELLQAMVYIYARVFDCCQHLAQYLGKQLDESISKPGMFNFKQIDARQIAYFKINSQYKYSLKSESIIVDPTFKPDLAFQNIYSSRKLLQNSIDTVFEYYKDMAKTIFSHFGDHKPMLFLFNEVWKEIDMMTTRFCDQTDKFIFWRHIADRMVTLQTFGLVWISEVWIRSHFGQIGTTAIKNMPIIDEQLQMVIIDRLGNRKNVQWKILRGSETTKPTLQEIPASDEKEQNTPYYLIPAMRAMGIPIPGNSI